MTQQQQQSQHSHPCLQQITRCYNTLWGSLTLVVSASLTHASADDITSASGNSVIGHPEVQGIEGGTGLIVSRGADGGEAAGVVERVHRKVHHPQ